MISARCYHHDTDVPEDLVIDDVSGHIDPNGGLVWVDTDEPASPAVQRLLDRLAINEFAQEDLASAGQRTKLAHYNDHFHVAVYDCVLEGSVLHAREVDIVFAPGWVLTVHQSPEDDGDPGALPITTVRRRFEVQRAQHERADVGLLLWALLDVIVDRYFVVTDAVDGRLDDAEDAVFDSVEDRRTDDDKQVLRLFALAKALVRFRRAAVPLRDVTAEIVRREIACIGTVAIVHFQDLADHVLRVAEVVESQRDVLTGLRDAELASASNRLSRSQQRIAAWGAILIVATLITGVLGMNFANAPELDWEEGFLVIFGVMALLGIPIFFYFKKRDWI